MSKIDALRAIREARYAQQAATPTTAARRPKPLEATAAEPAADVAAPASEELCGHRNMGGRTCTRERNHSAKSHRYS